MSSLGMDNGIQSALPLLSVTKYSLKGSSHVHVLAIISVSVTPQD